MNTLGQSFGMSIIIKIFILIISLTILTGCQCILSNNDESKLLINNKAEYNIGVLANPFYPDKSFERCSSFMVKGRSLETICFFESLCYCGGWEYLYAHRKYITFHFVKWEDVERDKTSERNYKILKTIVASKEDMVKNNWVLEFP